jgi:hypothetical protein
MLDGCQNYQPALPTGCLSANSENARQICLRPWPCFDKALTKQFKTLAFFCALKGESPCLAI